MEYVPRTLMKHVSPVISFLSRLTTGCILFVFLSVVKETKTTSKFPYTENKIVANFRLIDIITIYLARNMVVILKSKEVLSSKVVLTSSYRSKNEAWIAASIDFSCVFQSGTKVLPNSRQ